MVNNSEVVQEWFIKADLDLDQAEFFLENDRPLEYVGYFIQQAAEKYLKGFLISHGWELEKIHNLDKLLKECSKFDKAFLEFIPSFRKISRFYFEGRYPISYEVEYTSKEIKQALVDVKNLIRFVKEKIKA
jgi:HEPN domain-containing protein